MYIPHQELASWNRATDLVYAAGLAVRSLTGAVWYSPRLLWYLRDTLVAGLKGLTKPDLDYDPTLQEILRPSDWEDHRNNNEHREDHPASPGTTSTASRGSRRSFHLGTVTSPDPVPPTPSENRSLCRSFLSHTHSTLVLLENRNLVVPFS